MDRRRLFDRFDLNNHSRIDQEVDAQTIFEPKTVVLKSYSFLPLDLKAAFLQIAIEDRFINRFKESRTERRMQFERGIDDRTRYFVQ